MVKILHTADIHLDAHFNNFGAKGRLRRFDLKETFSKIIEKSLEEKADILLIAGDLFEDVRVTPDTINFVCAQLKRAVMPVFISPGNHDPYLPDSYYAAYPWPSNVHIFKENKFQKVEVEGLNVNIYGIANTSHEDKNNYLKNLRVDKNNQINIAMIHGSNLDCAPKDMETYFGFTTSDLISCGADYIALGHYHSYTPVIHNDKIAAAYSGIPEPLAFSDNFTCGVITAQIEKQNNNVIFKEIAKRKIINLEMNVNDAQNSQDIFDKITEGIQNYKDDIITISLKGDIPPHIKINSDDMVNIISDGTFFTRVNNLTKPYYDIENMSKEKTIRGEFLRRLLKKINHAEDDHNYDELLVYKKALLYGLDAFGPDVIEERN